METLETPPFQEPFKKKSGSFFHEWAFNCSHGLHEHNNWKKKECRATWLGFYLSNLSIFHRFSHIWAKSTDAQVPLRGSTSMLLFMLSPGTSSILRTRQLIQVRKLRLASAAMRTEDCCSAKRERKKFLSAVPTLHTAWPYSNYYELSGRRQTVWMMLCSCKHGCVWVSRHQRGRRMMCAFFYLNLVFIWMDVRRGNVVLARVNYDT